MTPTQTRRFVAAFVVLMIGLSILSALLITQGWQDEGLQETVREAEAAESVEGS